MSQSIANVYSEWIDGNLVFKKVSDGSVLATFDAVNSQLTVTSLEVETFALETQATFQDDLADVTGTVTDTDYNLAAAAINGIQDALIAAGIMAAS